jgi:serine/threonine protein kinase
MACLREAELLKLCKHPCIAEYYDSYVEKRLVFCLEMEWLGGGDLEGVVVGGQYEQLWKWIFQIASGLNHMHSLGVIHRDVKPDNIALDRNGNAKLIDLGTATFKWQLQADNFPMAGTPGYTSPEMIRRRYSL